MDTAALLPLLDQLDDHVDDLEDALAPLLGQALSKSSRNLPVLEQADFNVFITYTLETLIFSYLRLKGVDALQHPVYREITRVKQYFDKMKALQQPEEPTMKLDKEAAGRFIKHGLAGNNRIDLERAEREAKERAQATFKAAMLAKKNAAKSQEATASNDDSTGPAAEQSDEESDKEMQTAPSTGELQEKQKSKGSNTNPEIKKSKKKSKKAKHASGADRKDAKKERRSKKEKHRKAQKAQQSA